jgi:CheY-like chemotaxis protein
MSKRILFADGDQLMAEPVNTMLLQMGCLVQMETSGKETLDTFDNNPSKFDLVVMDVGMPDMSGLLLAEKLLRIRSDIPIVLLTGTDEQTRTRARASGIRWFGMKPVSIIELTQTVENALIGVA